MADPAICLYKKIVDRDDVSKNVNIVMDYTYILLNCWVNILY